jgi:hypothetical protein
MDSVRVRNGGDDECTVAGKAGDHDAWMIFMWNTAVV